MVALIDDQVPVVGHHVRHLALTDQALDQRHVDEPRRFLLAAADRTDALRIDIEEGR
jgi:hypothetical protein